MPRITHLVYRKSYLVIICSNSQATKTKTIIQQRFIWGAIISDFFCCQRFGLNCMRSNISQTLFSFFELVAADSYPQDCIAFACWLDTIKWYTLESTTSMVYRKDTQLFWCVVFKLFHGNAIRLFSGVNSRHSIKWTGYKRVHDWFVPKSNYITTRICNTFSTMIITHTQRPAPMAQWFEA